MDIKQRALIALTLMLAVLGFSAAPASATVLPPRSAVVEAASHTAAKAVKQAERLASPTNCPSGSHGSWPNTTAPYGTQWCVSGNWERNVCLRSNPEYSGPTFRYFKNQTGTRWLTFRVSDTTCSGAACGHPPHSEGTQAGWCSGWTTYGPKMRTSSTS